MFGVFCYACSVFSSLMWLLVLGWLGFACFKGKAVYTFRVLLPPVSINSNGLHV